jgi:hypothetical protein
VATCVCAEYVDCSSTFTFFTCYLNATPYFRRLYHTHETLLNIAHVIFLVSQYSLKELTGAIDCVVLKLWLLCESSFLCRVCVLLFFMWSQH